MADTCQLEPTHVTIPEACRLSGDESRSGIYNALGRGELRAIKCGKRILIELASIRERLANCPPARIKPAAPAAHADPAAA